MNTINAAAQLTPEELEGSLAIVQEIFKKFRPIILERAGKSLFTNKADGSEVTDTDVEVEKTLQAALAHKYPGMAVYGEETGYGDHLTGAFWLIDPIDGTKSFIADIPTFTSMAVLIQNAEAAACAIYNPSTDDMYTAQKGKGAYKNGTRLDLSRQPLARVADSKEEFIVPLNEMLREQGITSAAKPAGCGHGFAMVAEGHVAARFSLHGRGNTHDYAPGGLLVREAGGAIIPVLDDTYTYETRSFVACHPKLEATIRAHLQELRDLERTPRKK